MSDTFPIDTESYENDILFDRNMGSNEEMPDSFSSDSKINEYLVGFELN